MQLLYFQREKSKSKQSKHHFLIHSFQNGGCTQRVMKSHVGYYLFIFLNGKCPYTSVEHRAGGVV